MATKKVIALIRTSTEKQEVESQKRELIEYILKDGINEDDIIIVGQKGASAIKLDEAYKRNLDIVYKHIDEGNISAVYAWHLDRIGRNEEVLMNFKYKLIDNKVQLVIKNPSLRLLDDDGSVNAGMEMAFSLFATMAKQEMETKARRFERAKRRNAEQMKFNGGKVHFGYMVDDEGKIVVNEDEAAIVKLVFDLYLSGDYSTTKLAIELQKRGYTIRGKKVTLHFVTNMLKSTAFIGYTIYNKKDDEGNIIYTQKRIYPQIISEDKFNEVKARLTANIKGDITRQSKRVNLASKLIVCPTCGRHWYASNRTYTCIGHKYHGKDLQGVETCPNNEQISIEWLDVAAWYVAKSCEVDWMLNFTESKAEEAQKQIEVNQQKIATLEDLIAKVDAKRQRIVEMYIDMEISKADRDKRIAKVKEDAAVFERQIVELKEENDKVQMIADYDADIQLIHTGRLTMRGIYEDAEENYRICHKHIKSISVEPFEYEGKMQKMITIKTYYNDIVARILYIAKSKVKDQYHTIKLYQEYKGEFKPLFVWADMVSTMQNHLEEWGYYE